MMIPRPVLALIVCICYVATSRPLFINDELQTSFGNVVYTTIIFRHGDRTPIKTFPTDQIPMSFWKEGAGQLTKLGKKHEYELGTWFRYRYKHLLPADGYRYDRILVNSSDVDRTLMSAQLFLAGLYPPNENETWNDQLVWQPVPVHSIPKPLDNIISNGRPCNRYNLEKGMLNKSPEFEAFFEEHRALFEYVSAHSGLKMTKDDVMEAIGLFSDVYDAILIETLNDLTMPNWAEKVYPEPMRPLAAFFFSTLTYTNEMRRLQGGPLLKTIVDDLTEKASGGLANRTFHVYSGHDTTIAVILDTLDIFNRIAPPFSSAVLVELRKKQDDHFVSVLYRNSSVAAPYLLKVPGCESDVCTLDEFVRLSASKIPDNWEQECDIGLLEEIQVSSDSYLTFALYGILFFVSALAFVVFVKIYFTKIDRYRHYQTIQSQILNPEKVTILS